MAFQARQIDEVQAFTEISFGVATPGAVASGAGTLVGALMACVVGGPGNTAPATFALGDQLEVYPSAAAAVNGLSVSAFPTATPGTCELYFSNITGGSITPVAGAKYTIVATRLSPAVV
jgi:hypothetical protein